MFHPFRWLWDNVWWPRGVRAWKEDLRKADALRRQRRYDDSEKVLRRLLRLFPQDESALRRLHELRFAPDIDRADALHSEGRIREAEQIIENLIRRYPDDPEPYLQLAPMLFYGEAYKQAAEISAQAAALVWDDANQLMRAANTSWRGDPEATRRYLARIEELDAAGVADPSFLFRASLWHLEGLLAAQIDKDDELALERFAGAFQAEPDGVGHGADLALQLAQLGRFDDAREVLSLALKARPGDRRLVEVEEMIAQVEENEQ